MDVRWARSTNGGQGYTVFDGPYGDYHDVVAVAGRLYSANDGGFYRSTDGGGTWFHGPMAATQFYDLGIDPVDTRRRFGGTQDTGTLRTLDGGSATWNVAIGSDGFQCEVDPVDPMHVYCEGIYGNIYSSLNGGVSFTRSMHGIGTNDRTNWNAPIVHDPRTTQRVYTGTFRVYRTTDGAGTWTPISGDLTGGPPAFSADARQTPTGGNDHLENVISGTVTTVAASAVDGNVVWAGTDDGRVWVTRNGGSTWTRVDVPGRSEWVTRVEADPFSASTGYVTYSGYRYGSPLPRIFRTVDFGASWVDISGDLPDVPLNCVNADPDPAMRGRLYVCSDLGVFVTDNYGLTWSALGTGMPTVVVLDIDLIASSRQLFAGTHGRSIYLYDLNQLGPADADGDGRDNLADCRPDDPTLFAAPGEISGLALGSDRITLSWGSAAPTSGSATEHQVLRGLIAELPVGGASDACIVAGTIASSATDPVVPPTGAGFWYLVRARNACGTGTWGSTSGGSPHIGTACP
jgi:photosystem II stability/assembly factor-like uncharacterized protein